MAGVLNQLDCGKMDVVLFSGPNARSHVAAKLQNPDVRRAALPRNFLPAVEMLRDAECDLIYYWEVGTDPVNYFLPFFRPAPVQCTSWGWPVTSGIAAIDYFVSSRQLEPAGAAADYSEQLVELAEIPNYYYRPDVSRVVADRERFGLPAEQNIYFCPQNPRKFHPDFDPLIGGILRSDPAGLFVMLSSAPAWLSDALAARFARTLADVIHRVRILPRVTKSEFAILLASADVVLDTPHYGGGANTTYDALALAKPLVTLEGREHRGRYAAAACRAMGLESLVADSPEEYVRSAVELGTQPDLRETVAGKIRLASDGLFDNLGAVTEFEAFLLEAIELGRAG
jgi:predicted O-linked N-acetylglucosamine transferase (SPINDLY family)